MSKSDLNKTWTLLPDPDELNGTVSLGGGAAAATTTKNDTMSSPNNNNNTTFTAQSVAKTPTLGATAGHYHSLIMSGSKSTVNKYSPSKTAAIDFLLVRHLNIDESRVLEEWDNFEARYQQLESMPYDSLFDEVFNFPEANSLTSEEEAVINKVIVNENAPPQPPKSVTPISLSSCSSIDNNLDRLALSQTANEFNEQPLPNSLDLFIHDLRKSSSSKHLNHEENDNNKKSSGRLNLPSFRMDSKSIQPLPFASSMENELNKIPASVASSSSSKPPFIESLDLQTTTTMRTSSPSKNSSNSVLNRTIDIDKAAGGGSVESLSQQNYDHILAHDDYDEENQAVLNTTYTSWSTDLNQAEREACVQQEIINTRYGACTATATATACSVNNLTQDINNNSLNNEIGSKNKKVDLNRTYEMDEMMDVDNDDDQFVETHTGEPSAGRVLNRTHDLIDDADLIESAPQAAITKPVIAAAVPAVSTIGGKASSQTSSSRLTSIFNKPAKAATTTSTTSTSKTPSPLSQLKKTELIKPVVGTSGQNANSGAGGNNTKLPVRNSIPTINTQIKSGIPSVKLISSTTSTTTTSHQQQSNKQQQHHDVNRLSSSSTASSASTGSSSSKENRKSITGSIDTTEAAKTGGGGVGGEPTVVKSFGFVSKLKKPGVVAPPATTSQTSITPTSMNNSNNNKMTSGVSKLPSGSSIPTIPKMPSYSALPTANTVLKNPTQILKKPSSVLTLRNANSQQIKK